MADDGADFGAVLKADAVNRGRYLECQRMQRAAVRCLINIENAGLLTRQANSASAKGEQ